MTPKIYHLVYSSEAQAGFKIEDLLFLVDQARANNEKKDINGILLFYNRFFLQILEGDKDKIISLFEKINKDKRHFNVQLIEISEQNSPLFSEWRLGLANFPTELPQLNPDEFILKNLQLSISDANFVAQIKQSFFKNKNLLKIQ